MRSVFVPPKRQTTILRYLALAQSDADANHKVASPVMNWRL